ncbi:hypothetical protein AHAS_Ahas13G0146600 [Arachis hypogaea]
MKILFIFTIKLSIIYLTYMVTGHLLKSILQHLYMLVYMDLFELIWNYYLMLITYFSPS